MKLQVLIVTYDNMVTLYRIEQWTSNCWMLKACQPGSNSDIASPHSTHFLWNWVEPGFSQPTYVCGFKWVETGSRMARFVRVHQERFSSAVALSIPIIWQQALVLSFALAVLKLPRLFKFTELASTWIECGRVLTEFNPDRSGLPSTRINPVS